jgi:putative intracellular protease/amidase
VYSYNTKTIYVRGPVKTRVSANTFPAGVRRLVGDDVANAVADKALTATAAASDFVVVVVVAGKHGPMTTWPELGWYNACLGALAQVMRMRGYFYWCR